MWGDGCGGALSLFLEKLPGIPDRQADSGGNKLNDNAAYFRDSREGVDKKLWYNALFFLLIVILYYISTGGIHMDDIKSPSAVTIGELSRIVKEFEEKIQNGTEDPDRFLTLTEIEELWGKLIGDTNVLYSDMLQSLIQNIDERELVRQKKENSRPEE